MRKTKKVKLDDKEIDVFELRVKDYLTIVEKLKGNTDMTPAMFFEEFQVILPKAISMTYDELIEYAPSELELLFEAFKECNATFFSLLGRVGLDKLPSILSKAIESDLLKVSAGSLPQVTE